MNRVAAQRQRMYGGSLIVWAVLWLAQASHAQPTAAPAPRAHARKDGDSAATARVDGQTPVRTASEPTKGTPSKTPHSTGAQDKLGGPAEGATTATDRQKGAPPKTARESADRAEPKAVDPRSRDRGEPVLVRQEPTKAAPPKPQPGNDTARPAPAPTRPQAAPLRAPAGRPALRPR